MHSVQHRFHERWTAAAKMESNTVLCSGKHWLLHERALWLNNMSYLYIITTVIAGSKILENVFMSWCSRDHERKAI